VRQSAKESVFKLYHKTISTLALTDFIGGRMYLGREGGVRDSSEESQRWSKRYTIQACVDAVGHTKARAHVNEGKEPLLVNGVRNVDSSAYSYRKTHRQSYA